MLQKNIVIQQQQQQQNLIHIDNMMQMNINHQAQHVYIYINFIIILFDLFIYLDFLSQETDEITNRSRRLDPYLFYSFIIGLYSFVQ
jgi:hypothetical protein